MLLLGLWHCEGKPGRGYDRVGVVMQKRGAAFKLGRHE